MIECGGSPRLAELPPETKWNHLVISNLECCQLLLLLLKFRVIYGIEPGNILIMWMEWWFRMRKVDEVRYRMGWGESGPCAIEALYCQDTFYRYWLLKDILVTFLLHSISLKPSISTILPALILDHYTRSIPSRAKTDVSYGVSALRVRLSKHH